MPELDHFPGRRDVRYWGAVLSEPRGVPPVWPEGVGPKAFVYVKPEHTAVALRPALLTLRREVF